MFRQELILYRTAPRPDEVNYNIHETLIFQEYGQRDTANAFLIGQFVKFFLLIGPSNALKHL